MNGELNPRLKTHNLVRLSSRAGVMTSAMDVETLRALQYSIEAGKYPIGLKPLLLPESWLQLDMVPLSLDLVRRIEAALAEAAPGKVFDPIDPSTLGM